jgi:hypothetical protein
MSYPAFPFPPVPGCFVLVAPLDSTLSTHRGSSGIVLEPPEDCCRKGPWTPVFELPGRPNAVTSYLLGVALGLKTIGPCCDKPRKGFLHTAVRARICWGTGDAKFEAELDWLCGTQIAVGGENLGVSARYEIEVPPGDEGLIGCPELPTYQLSAGTFYGASGRNSNSARFTELVQIETPGKSQTIPIPDFALSFNVQIVGPQTGALVELLPCGTGYAVPFEIVAPATNVGQHDMESAFPKPNGMRFLRVTNTGAAGPLFAFVIFGLAL